MSLTATQRTALNIVSRPPGPPSFWYAVGSVLRNIGGGLDAFGVTLQEDCAHIEKLPIPTTALKHAGKAPTFKEASFVAPSSNMVGAVTVGKGASVWYASLLKGDKGAVNIGEMTSVGERAIIVSSIVGNGTAIGAGSIVQSSKLGSGVSVGCGCKIFNGCTIGDNAILTAGSLLPAGTNVPGGEVWSGSPAKKVGAATGDDAAGLARTLEITAELAALHMDEAWKDLSLVEQEHADYKRAETHTPERAASLRYDPKWVPLPSLGEHLTRIGVHDHHYVPK